MRIDNATILLWQRYLYYKGLKASTFIVHTDGGVYVGGDKKGDVSDGLTKDEAEALGLTWKQIDHQTAQGWKPDGADGVQTGPDASIIMPEEIQLMEGNVKRYAHDFGITIDEAEKLFFTFKLVPVGDLRGTYNKYVQTEKVLTEKYSAYTANAANTDKSYIGFLKSQGVPYNSYLMVNGVSDVKSHLRLAFISTIPFSDKQQEIFNLKAPTDNHCDDPYNVNTLLEWSKAAMPASVTMPGPAVPAAPGLNWGEADPNNITHGNVYEIIFTSPLSEDPMGAEVYMGNKPIYKITPTSTISGEGIIATTFVTGPTLRIEVKDNAKPGLYTVKIIGREGDVIASYENVFRVKEKTAEPQEPAMVPALAEDIETKAKKEKIQESIRHIIGALNNNNTVILKRPGLQYKFSYVGGELSYFTSNSHNLELTAVEETWTPGEVGQREAIVLLNEEIGKFANTHGILGLDVLSSLADKFAKYSSVKDNTITFKTDGESSSIEQRFLSSAQPEASAPALAAPALISAAQQEMDAILYTKIMFTEGYVNIDDSQKAVLDNVARLIQNHPEWEIEIHGHARDSQKQDLGAYDWGLGYARAEAVCDYLVLRGMNFAKLLRFSYGNNRPIAANDTEEGRKQNDRVEFIVKEQAEESLP